MAIKIEPTPLIDCFVLHDQLLKDDRGYFFESYNANRFKETTHLDVCFVQDNQSKSSYGVLRGMHFQKDDHAQAKLVRVIQGTVQDVVVDLRPHSPTYKKHFSIVLSESSHTQLFVPRGFAHGFLVLSQEAIFFYKCDNFYHPAAEAGICYNDPSIGIEWQLPAPHIKVNAKDLSYKPL